MEGKHRCPPHPGSRVRSRLVWAARPASGSPLLRSRPAVRLSAPHAQQHSRLPCPSPPASVSPSSRPLRRWCHPSISSSVALFSFCLQSFPAWGSFPMSPRPILHLLEQGSSTFCLMWNWCNNRNKVYNNVMHWIPQSKPLPLGQWKNCLPWNQPMVPKRLGTAILEDTLYSPVVVYYMTYSGLCLTHVCPYFLLLKSRPDLMTCL